MVRVVAVLIAFALACGSARAAPEQPLRVLFIGNSLTSWNNLPGFVKALAASRGDTTFTYRMIAPPAVALEDHWNLPRTRAALANERWDVVVMQQGPSAEAAGRAHLCEWSRRFADLARARGARPYLLGVWSAGRFGLPEVIDSYAAAGVAADAPVLPAGAAWRAAWRRKPSLALHTRDGLHPSRVGAYLAALVVYAGLRDVSPLTLPSTLVVAKTRLTVSRANAAVLRAAAAEALDEPVAGGPCRI
jgi:hypothetical protein